MRAHGQRALSKAATGRCRVGNPLCGSEQGLSLARTHFPRWRALLAHRPRVQFPLSQYMILPRAHFPTALRVHPESGSGLSPRDARADAVVARPGTAKLLGIPPKHSQVLSSPWP